MAKNSNYKLTYFPIRGIAEPIRLIFAYAGVNYEDIRVPFEEWPTKKSTTPFRTMPILEVDGEVLGQSNAIARLLAKRFNLAGGDDVEQAKVDALADYVSDSRGGILGFMREKDEARKINLREEYFSTTLPGFFEVFEEHLKKNRGGHEFFVGNGPTFADLSIAAFVYTCNGFHPGVLDKFPLLKDHMDRVHNLNGIKEWVAKRPQTQM